MARMKLRRSLIMVLLSVFFIAALPVQAQSAPDKKNRVIVLGTIHGDHKTSKRYSLAVLRRVLIAVKPDQIITEIPPERVALAFAGFRKTGRVTESRVSDFPEYVDVVFPLTTSQKFTVVGAAGWTQALADERSAALKRIAADPARRTQWNIYQQANARSEKEIGDRADDPLFIHTTEYDALVERAQTPYQQFFDADLGPGAWTPINQAHYRLIANELDRVKGRGLTIVITFSSWHKYWILRELAKRDDIDIVDPKPYFSKIVP
jgi:hypothetical protein